MVGFFCLGAAMTGSLVVMLKVRDPVKSVEGMAMGESGTSWCGRIRPHWFGKPWRHPRSPNR